MSGVPGWGHSLGLGLVQALVRDGHYLLQNVPDVLLPSASRDPPTSPTGVSATGRLARAPGLRTYQPQTPTAPARRRRPQQPLVHSWGGGLRPPPCSPLPPPGDFPPKLAGAAAPSAPTPPGNPPPGSPRGFTPALKGRPGVPPGHPHRRPRPPAAEKMEPEREREREEAQAGVCVREEGGGRRGNEGGGWGRGAGGRGGEERRNGEEPGAGRRRPGGGGGGGWRRGAAGRPGRDWVGLGAGRKGAGVGVSATWVPRPWSGGADSGLWNVLRQLGSYFLF